MHPDFEVVGMGLHCVGVAGESWVVEKTEARWWSGEFLSKLIKLLPADSLVVPEKVSGASKQAGLWVRKGGKYGDLGRRVLQQNPVETRRC